MPQEHPRLVPHPRTHLDQFAPAHRVSVGYELPRLFQQECSLVLTALQTAVQIRPKTLSVLARRAFYTNNFEDDTLLLYLYTKVLEHLEDVSNTQPYEHTRGYQGLFSSPAMGSLARWIGIGTLSNVATFIRNTNVTLSRISTDVPSDLLFSQTPFKVIISQQEQRRMTGTTETIQRQDAILERLDALVFSQRDLANTLQEMAVQSESDELVWAMEVPVPWTERVRRWWTRVRTKHNTPEPACELETMFDALHQQQEAERENKRLASIPLPEFVNYAIKTQQTQGKSTSSTDIESYTVYWTSPPPITPLTLYSFVHLTESERNLILTLFLDLYTTEMGLLSLQLFVDRIRQLWTKSSGLVELGLFSQEVPDVQRHILAILPTLENKFTVEFLSIEGIVHAGAKLESLLGVMFQPGQTHIVNILDSVTELLSLLRVACLATERLRVSLLYGPGHPSYVGKDLVSSYLYRYYLMRHATIGLDQLTHTAESLRITSLPESTQQSFQFYHTVSSDIPDSAAAHGVTEGSLRQTYPLPKLCLPGESVPAFESPTQAIFPTLWEVPSLYPVTPMQSSFFRLLDRMWNTPAQYHTITQEEYEALLAQQALAQPQKID